MSVLKNKRIAHKANILFLALSLGITGATAGGVAYIHELYVGQQEAYGTYATLQHAAASIAAANQGAAKSTGRIVLGAATPDAAAIEGYHGETARYHEKMADGIQQLEALAPAGDMRDAVPAMARNETTLREMSEALYQLGMGRNPVDAKKIYEGTYYPLSNALQDQIQSIQSQAGKQAEGSQAQLRQLRHSLYGLLGGSLAVLLLAVYLLQRQVIRNFKRIFQKLHQSTADLRDGQQVSLPGDEAVVECREFVQTLLDMDRAWEAYTQDIRAYAHAVQTDRLQYERNSQISYPGRFELIDTSLAGISNHLMYTAATLRKSCDAVLEDMSDLADMGQGLYQGRQEQENLTEEVLRMTRELKTGLQTLSQELTDMGKYPQAFDEQIAESKRNAQTIGQQFSQIGSVSGELTDTVSGMEKMAYQMNLLAVDAAIEARRAGSTSGGGMAGMTKRIQNLSSRMSQLSLRTGQHLETIDTLADEGSREHHAVAVQLEKLQTGMAQLAAVVMKISEATQQQCHVVEQVVQYSDSLNEMMLESTAIAEDNSQAGTTVLKKLQALSEEISKAADVAPNQLKKKK